MAPLGTDEGVMQTTIPAVECSVCKRLFKANVPGYVLLVGRVIRPGVGALDRRNTRVKQLGDENSPLVVCDLERCIMTAMGSTEYDDH